MLVNVIARHGALADETKEKIVRKLTKLERFHERITSIEAMVDLSHSANPEVEIIVGVEKSHKFVAHTKAHTGNLIGAVDAAEKKLQEQLKRHKNKQIEQHRTPHPRDSVASSENED